MTNVVAVPTTQQNLAKIEQVLIGGDLSKLTPEERLSYYRAVCESVGLNPLTKPFDYITLNSKLVLYAKRDATDQLRKVYGVSIKITARETIEGVYVVTAQAKMPNGREDESTGAVQTTGLKGDMLANAYMKAETKAKRRVTLSICGLGMLDETEVADIPANDKRQIFAEQPGPDDGKIEEQDYRIGFGEWKGRSLDQVHRIHGLQKIIDRITFLESPAYKTKYGELRDVHHEFIERASDFIAFMESKDPEELAAELAEEKA